MSGWSFGWIKKDSSEALPRIFSYALQAFETNRQSWETFRSIFNGSFDTFAESHAFNVPKCSGISIEFISFTLSRTDAGHIETFVQAIHHTAIADFDHGSPVEKKPPTIAGEGS